MSAETVLYVIIAGVSAFALALFMYGYKTKYTKSLRWLFSVFRFITLFSLFLLLINPKFKSVSYTVEKPKLPVLVDISSSISSLNQEENVKNIVSQIQDNEALNDKFDVSIFSFGNDFNTLDSIYFSDRQTNIDKALKTTEGLFKNTIAPTMLISDGNQTFGADYEYSSVSFSNAIHPIVVGDSTAYVDLRIEQLNTNRYSFLKNEFPLEAILVYNGEEAISQRFEIRKSGNVVHSEVINFTKTNNSQIVSIALPSTTVGLQRYSATITPLSEEKNKTNNTKVFAVEVIDQATNILIVSDIKHPDLGAFRKSIETNEQRKVTFLEPSKAAGILNDYQLVILYQPDRSFESVLTEIDRLKKNALFVTGLQTDWNFLNASQNYFNKEAASATEDVSAAINFNYGSYAVEDIGFSNFPPLQTTFGELNFKVPNETLLQQTINGFSTSNSLFSSLEVNGIRIALWDGEGIWKWRASNYLNSENFEDFDKFIGKIVQYLASNKSRTRLEVNHETFYYSNSPMLIAAQYFDKNFVFDNRAQLEITVVNKETNKTGVFPLLLKNNYYEVALNSLPEGDYNYTVAVKDEAVARSGNFTILDFNVEQQFMNANVTKLQKVATNTGGEVYFADNFESLFSSLINNEAYKAIERSQQKVVPLIDWKYLLGLIALMLSAEWLIRKYNGLI